MFISIGNSCKVREAIQRHLSLKTMETNIFDWVLTNFYSIIYILENIDSPFQENDFYDSSETCLNHRRIQHHKIRFGSIHDIRKDLPYEEQLPQFLEKYNRRLQRFKEHILGNETIYFIHLVDCNYNFRLPNKPLYIPSYEEVQSFHKALYKINPHCQYQLHILIPPPYCKVYKKDFHFDKNEVNLLQNENTFIHYLEQDELKETFNEQCRHWSWDTVFQNIIK